MITIIILVAIYIGIIKLSLYLLYLDSYAKCQSRLTDNRKENVEQVCKNIMTDVSWICFIPVVNLIIALSLSIMVLIDGLLGN